jgi:hypothetical protein
MQVALKNTQAVQRINRMSTVSSSQLRGLNIKELAKEKKTATASTIVCGGFLVACMPAQALEGLSSVPSQILEISDAPTPFLYVGFLASSLAFTVATYIALSKIKLI